jgi:acetyl esterase/lipase
MRTTKQLILAATLCTASICGQSMREPSILLWPNGAPGETAEIGPEADTTTGDGNLVSGKRVIRLGNVSEPSLTLYQPPAGRSSGAAVIVLPGGGYNILAMDLEGTEICEWLNSIGVTGILLKYRVPAKRDGPRAGAPLQDAQRAVRLVRQNASKWKIDPARIGVLGFSAGGHLAAAVSNNFEKGTYEAIDAADQLSSRPDFTVLIYPAYLTLREDPQKLPPELPVTSRTPPTFIVQTEDDSVPVENTLGYYAALKAAKVPAEMHIYAVGGHGYGLRPSMAPVSVWPKLAEAWFRWSGILKTDGSR